MKRFLLWLPYLYLTVMAAASAQIVAPSPSAKAPSPTYAPPSYVPASPAQRAPLPPAALPPPSTVGGGDAGARQLENTLPLDPATRNLQDQVPPNPGAVERQLGLRQPVGPVTDLRGRAPSPQEIVNGLNKH
jgi:hypothetical protein